MLYQEKDLPELHQLKHRNDDQFNYVDYEKNILNKSLSPYLYNNVMMAKFLDLLQKPLAQLFDRFNIVKNYRNYIVDKYYHKHTN